MSKYVAPSKKTAAPPPPPPPPPPEEKKDVPADVEHEEEQLLEFMGYQVKVPKIPPMPNWMRVIMEYRFPSSIDPYTGETLLSTPELQQHNAFNAKIACVIKPTSLWKLDQIIRY